MIEQPFPVEQSIQLTGAAMLVSGASFAGPATAYWMNRLGYRVTVIEVASGLRKGGTPVDIEGETIGVLAGMGMIDAVRAKALPPRGLEFKNADDSKIGAMEAQSVSDDAPNERCEIHRDDLLQILFASLEGAVEMMFSQSIKQLDQVPSRPVTWGNRGSDHPAGRSGHDPIRVDVSR
jgi:2-polyprenyl-6-methoxyphenol hydroxylase-like FAD-dependent oxidoreductase